MRRKALLDVPKTRDVACRHKDGTVPAKVPRILTTNWPWERFWPQEAFMDCHMVAIKRRVLWVPVMKDLRRNRPPAKLPEGKESADMPTVHEGQDEEDPFGFSGRGADRA